MPPKSKKESQVVISNATVIISNSTPNSKPKKEKRPSIPKKIRQLVWNTHIGESTGMAKCLCCNEKDISQMEFHCGHIISYYNGGADSVENMRPICASCNLSMGSENMNTFIERHQLTGNISNLAIGGGGSSSMSAPTPLKSEYTPYTSIFTPFTSASTPGIKFIPKKSDKILKFQDVENIAFKSVFMPKTSNVVPIKNNMVPIKNNVVSDGRFLWNGNAFVKSDPIIAPPIKSENELFEEERVKLETEWNGRKHKVITYIENVKDKKEKFKHLLSTVVKDKGRIHFNITGRDLTNEGEMSNPCKSGNMHNKIYIDYGISWQPFASSCGDCMLSCFINNVLNCVTRGHFQFKHGYHIRDPLLDSVNLYLANTPLNEKFEEFIDGFLNCMNIDPTF